MIRLAIALNSENKFIRAIWTQHRNINVKTRDSNLRAHLKTHASHRFCHSHFKIRIGCPVSNCSGINNSSGFYVFQKSFEVIYTPLNARPSNNIFRGHGRKNLHALFCAREHDIEPSPTIFRVDRPKTLKNAFCFRVGTKGARDKNNITLIALKVFEIFNE